jgi:hypothetical protein
MRRILSLRDVRMVGQAEIVAVLVAVLRDHDGVLVGVLMRVLVVACRDVRVLMRMIVRVAMLLGSVVMGVLDQVVVVRVLVTRLGETLVLVRVLMLRGRGTVVVRMVMRMLVVFRRVIVRMVVLVAMLPIGVGVLMRRNRLAQLGDLLEDLGVLVRLGSLRR